MAGRRYTTSNYTMYGTPYVVELFDADLVGDTTNIWTLATPGCKLVKDKATYGPNGGIKRSRAVITWRVETTAEQLLLEGMAQYQETKFFIKITIDGNLEFFGPLIVDNVKIQNSGLPYDAQLIFSDGLSFLKESKTELTYSTSFDLVMQMLRGADPASIIGNTEVFCSTSIRWFEEEMPYSTNFNPFARWRLGGEFNVIRDVKSNEWFTHYEILERFVMAFGAWIEMSGGRFRIMNLSAVTAGDVVWHTYARNYAPGNISFGGEVGVIQNGVQENIIVTEGNEQVARVDDGVSYGYLPQLRRIERTYKYDGYNILFNRSNFDPSTLFYVQNINDPSGASYLRLNAAYAIDIINNSGSIAYTLRPKYVATVQIVDGGTTHYYNGVSWVTSAATFAYYGQQRTLYAAQSTFYSEVVSMVTADIPTEGSLSVEIDVSIVDLAGNTIAMIDVNNFACQWIQIFHETFDATYLRDALFKVKNSASRSSKVDELPDAFLGDGPSPASNTRIVVYTGSGQWKDSEKWRNEETGVYTKIIGLQLQEMMRHFSLPKRRYDMRISGFLPSYKTLSYDSKIMMFSSYGYDADADQNVCEMIEVDRVATDYDEEVVDIVNGVVLDTFGVSELPTGTGSIGVPIDATDGVASGTVSSITVVPIDVDGPIQGQKITILNPTNGESQEVELSADWDAADTTISIVEITLANIYPVGSLLLMPSEEASNAINRRSSGYIAGLKVGPAAIGTGSNKVLIDTANGNMTLEGNDIRLNGLPDESEASTGQLCVTSEGVVKVKS